MSDHAAITLVTGDITGQRADAIVSAGNPSLLGGGGVGGAIIRTGGPEILEACRLLRSTSLSEGLLPGQAIATTAGRLPAQWVIHTDGPIWSPSEDRTGVLMTAYRECLRVADQLAVSTIAFPAISAGAYGWPLVETARVGVTTAATTPTQVAEVTFVLRDPRAYDAFRMALAELGG